MTQILDKELVVANLNELIKSDHVWIKNLVSCKYGVEDNPSSRIVISGSNGAQIAHEAIGTTWLVQPLDWDKMHQWQRDECELMAKAVVAELAKKELTKKEPNEDYNPT